MSLVVVGRGRARERRMGSRGRRGREGNKLSSFLLVDRVAALVVAGIQ